MKYSRYVLFLLTIIILSNCYSQNLYYNIPNDLSQSSNIKSMYHDGFDATLYFLAYEGNSIEV